MGPVRWPSGSEPALGSSCPFRGRTGWEEPSGKFPCVEMASIARVVPGPQPEDPACLENPRCRGVAGQFGLEVLAGFGLSSAHAPTPTRGWLSGPSRSEARELPETTRELDRKGVPSCPPRTGLTSWSYSRFPLSCGERGWWLDAEIPSLPVCGGAFSLRAESSTCFSFE